MNIKKLIVPIIAVVVILVVVLSSFASVGPTERGIIVTMGKPSTEVLEPGLHFKTPFMQSVLTWDLTPIEYQKDISADSNEAPVTSDKQSLGLGFAMYWSYDPDRLYEVATMYKTKDSIYEPLSSALKSCVKDEIGKWSIDDIVTNQSTVQERIRSSLENDKDVQRLPIRIQSFRLSNIDWSKEYDDMIKKTMARKQEVEQMKQEVALTEQSNQKQIKAAEAALEAQRLDAEATRVAAEGAAAAALAKAEGEAAAALAKAQADAEAKKLAADAELYEAEQIAKAAESKKALWAHEEKLKYYETWNGKEVSDVMVMTPNGTLTTVSSR